MNKTNKILLLIVIVAAVGAAIYLLTPPEKKELAEVNDDLAGENIDLNEGEVLDGEKVKDVVYTEEDRVKFEAFLTENISLLSDAPATLGFIFTITSFNWLGNNEVVVFYDDGHNAYQAQVGLAYNNDLDVIIDNVQFIKINNGEDISEPVINETVTSTQEINEELNAELLIEEPILLEEPLLMEEQILMENE